MRSSKIERSEPALARLIGLEVLHLDMDAFFAAVEVHDNPELRGQPVLVGGAGARGVVASASYEARAFGVRAAMSTAEARRRCPGAIVVAGNYDKYAAVSKKLKALLWSVTPIVEPIALDEAFLDLQGAHGLLGSSRSIATSLRQRVMRELDLSCSVGVGRTKLIAKLASESAKPVVGSEGPVFGPGVVVVEEREELDFLHKHQTRSLPGVGPKTAERLTELGIRTIGDLAEVAQEHLVAIFGNVHGRQLYELSRGDDRRQVVSEHVARSIGHEQTYPTDLFDRALLLSRVRELADSVATRCRTSRVRGKCVSVKVRFGDFSSFSRARTSARPIESGSEIAEIAALLLEGLDVHRGIRLIGISMSSFEDTELERADQLEMFRELGDHEIIESTRRHVHVESTTDAIRQRFGDGAISSAASFGRNDTPAYLERKDLPITIEHDKDDESG